MSNDAVPKEEEYQLVRRIIAGDKEEFRSVLNQHKEMIFALIMRQVGERAIAEDLTQETFVKAYLNLSKFRFESKLGTWITRIALNQTNNYFASKKCKESKLSVSFDPGIHDQAAQSQNPNDSRVQEEKEHKLNSFRQALSTLKPLFREVLVLCSLEGKSYEEAAQILDVPVGTVRSRLNKARLLMKDAVLRIVPEEAANEA